MIDKIYFVQNYYGIEGFLSLYDPKESNLIVTGQQSGSLDQLLDQIMPGVKRLFVPGIREHRMGSFYKTRFTRFKVFLLMLYYRFHYAGRLQKLGPFSPSTTAYYFGKSGNIHFSVLLSFLAKQGVRIVCIGVPTASADKDFGPVPLSFTMKLDLWLLHMTSGARFSWNQLRKLPKIKPLCWENGIHLTPYIPEPLEKIARKFDLPMESSEGAILVLDTLIQSQLDIKQTQKNLELFFQPLLDRGIQIHLKPHPDRPNDSVFSGISFEKEVKPIPGYLPAQMLMPYYSQVYFFLSSAGGASIAGEKYSLFHLLVFQSETKQKKYWTSLQEHIGPDKDQVEIVEWNT